MGGTKPIASVVLVANGISFAIMTAIFTTIGSAADYGMFGRWILFTVTLIFWAARMLIWHSHVRASLMCAPLRTQRCRLAPDRWKLAMGLYIVGFVSYGVILVWYAAAFRRLARNTPHSRSLREEYENGHICVEEYEREESLEKHRISNISTVGPGTCLTCDSMLIPVH
jgi:hypothetical protein